MVAVRWIVNELPPAVTVTVPLLLPEAGETVSQCSLLTVQLVLEMMSNEVCSPVAVKLREVVDTDKSGGGIVASCVTLMVCFSAELLQLTVMVAVRSLVVGLAAAMTVIVPSLLPEVWDIASHDEALLLTFQLVLDLMLNVFCPPEVVKFSEGGETDSALAGELSSIVPKAPQTGSA